jgi:hypothetical protein
MHPVCLYALTFVKQIVTLICFFRKNYKIGIYNTNQYHKYTIEVMSTLKILKKIMIILVLSMCLVTPLGASVEPELHEDWESGNAAFECGQIGSGGDFAYKVEPWDEGDPSGDYTYNGNTITIEAYYDEEDEEYKSFDWTSDYPVLAVIVKAGQDAYVYWYPGGSTGDTDLIAPDNKGVSHATFCIDEPGDGQIIVKKVIDWGYYSQYVEGFDFTFDPSWTDDFTLEHMEQESFTLPPDTYTVTETGMDGWTLFKVTIEGGGYDDEISGPTAEVELEAGETITITFFNRPPDFVIPENPLGTLGSLMAMVGVAALVTIFRKGVQIDTK